LLIEPGHDQVAWPATHIDDLIAGSIDELNFIVSRYARPHNREVPIDWYRNRHAELSFSLGMIA
jgi:hypothetical protein